MRLGALRPAALVEYDRLAFVHPAETTRVTFDMRLRAAVTGLDLFSPGVMLRPADEATEILEIKFDSCFPAHIRALLAGMTAQRCAISKYVMCRPLRKPVGAALKRKLLRAAAPRGQANIRGGLSMNGSDVVRMLFSSQTIGTASIPLVLFSVVLAFAVGLGIAAVYRFNFRGVMYSSNFTLTLF